MYDNAVFTFGYAKLVAEVEDIVLDLKQLVRIFKDFTPCFSAFNDIGL